LRDLTTNFNNEFSIDYKMFDTFKSLLDFAQEYKKAFERVETILKESYPAVDAVVALMKSYEDKPEEEQDAALKDLVENNADFKKCKKLKRCLRVIKGTQKFLRQRRRRVGDCMTYDNYQHRLHELATLGKAEQHEVERIKDIEDNIDEIIFDKTTR